MTCATAVEAAKRWHCPRGPMVADLFGTAALVADGGWLAG
jgi:hypothetical protein